MHLCSGTAGSEGNFHKTGNISILQSKSFYQLCCLCLANKRILSNTDNQIIVFAINKQSCKDSQLMNMVRQLVVAAMTFNIDFRAEHLPGKYNLVPDFLSRLQEAKAR
jgi:hypothetical protein